MPEIKLISIVVPGYNEETNIRELYNEILPVLQLAGSDFEIIFADDGSRDQTFEVIKSIANEDKHVSGLSLSRNFGHQVALMAGLQNAKGDIVIMMDADLQHPPSVIPLLIEQYQKGFDIVNTRRIDSKDVGVVKKATSKGFYKFINAMSDVYIEPSSSDFRLMSRKAVDAFLQFEEKSRFTRGLVSWMGFRQTIIEYNALERFSGKSKYTFRKMFRFGMDGLTSFSSKPLRISFYSGLIVFFIGTIYAIYATIEYFRGETTQGWASMLITILMLGGFQLLSIGVVGEYIARIFNESKARPLYFIKDKTDSE
jgi:polyisoprenyl-phosphate glycosyltransferase